MNRALARRTLAATLLSTLAALSGCQLAPSEGGLGRIEVYSVPRTRAEIHTNQQVAEALEAYDSDIRDRRLWRAACELPTATEGGGPRRWNGWVRLPARGVALADQVVLTRGPGQPVREVLEFAGVEAPTGSAATRPASASTPGGRADFRPVRCHFDGAGLPQQLTLLSAVPPFELDFSRAERARHRQFSDEDLAQGRIGYGHCSLKDVFGEVYHQPAWLFHIPAGLTLRPGDVVEARLGEMEGGDGAGRISTMSRRLGRHDDFAPGTRTAVPCR